MEARFLRERLGAVVAIAAAACGGKIAGDGSSDASAPLPPEEDVCPYIVEVRGFDLTVSPERACELAAGAPPCFGAFCEPSKADCAKACGDPAVNACTLPSSFLADFKIAQRDGRLVCPPASEMTLHCAVNERHGTKTNGCPVEGRRPSRLAARPAESDGSLGAYFAECEWLEAASITAFEDLASDLEQLGAHHALVEACRAAARDEARHATTMGTLRARFGGDETPVVLGSRASRSLLDVAIENAVEGTIRETFGAAVALWRAAHAADSAVQRALRAIAEDECRHAALAREVESFLSEQLDANERALVARSRRDAIASLAAEVGRSTQVVSRVAGVPTRREARALLDVLSREVWDVEASGAAVELQ